ncbi:HK97 family phage prohead protease [Candidatus Bodocaedibacter vickermanii]|uniref:HK97 family phage prohead protease n=1 Tax=Candidatus Bodocaedibacter vickermanii TaxID=2741701 RepID=A0A7L9RSK1_9PROT|nr:HK97 family phage prohead protease [Candidatus Paracaedibacteraceae bacterium 'Lake Konstanz']
MQNEVRTIKIEGYASIFHEPDQLKDVLLPGAFSIDKSVGVPVLWQHYPGTPVGRVVSAIEDKLGLWVTLELCLETQVGKEAAKLIQSRILSGLSIGYTVIKSARGSGDVRRVLHKVALKEISLVTFPAHVKARIKFD